MINKYTKTIVIILTTALILAVGCSSGNGSNPPSVEQPTEVPIAETFTVEPTLEPTVEPTLAPTAEPIDYSVTKPYEVGQIMILMYHYLTDETTSSPYDRTREDFRNDLQTLYDRGFRLISMKDLIVNNITTPAGFTPVVITFDDGHNTAFSLIESNGELIPDPNCAVGIMQQFAAAHPDFGCSATFYVNGDKPPFPGDGTLEDRIGYLVSNGFDVGNHTNSHLSMKDLTAEEIQKELGITDKMIKDAMPGYYPVGIAYPFGIQPAQDLIYYLRDGEYEGHSYHYDFALCVGQSGSPSAPNRVDFAPFNMPRVRASNNEDTDLGWSFDFFEQHPEYRYVSDGDPQTIVVPEAYNENVNENSLGNKNLILY